MNDLDIEYLYKYHIDTLFSGVPTGEEILNGSANIDISNYDRWYIVYLINECVKTIGKYIKNNKINIMVETKMNDFLYFIDQCDDDIKLLTVNLLIEYYKFNETSFNDERWRSLYRLYRS